MYFLGADCGGSKTQFTIATEKGKIVSSVRTGCGSFFALDADGIRDHIHEGASEAAALAGIALKDIAFTAAGFPGYGEKEDSERDIFIAVMKAMESNNVICVNDCEVGWAGSLALKAGINIIAGTGSNCYGKNHLGQTARSSGWGDPGDEGSCTWIARHLLQIYTKQADYRLPRTELYEAVRRYFSIDKDLEFIYRLNNEVMPGNIAPIQILAKELAENGEPYSRELYNAAAEELALSINGVAKQLNMRPGYPASYSGGLFRSGKLIIDPLRLAVERYGGKLVEPKYTPEQGAILLAIRAYRADLIRENLVFTE